MARLARIARKGERPGLALPDAQVAWHEATFRVGRYVGAPHSHITPSKAHVSLNGEYAYDVRILSPEDDLAIQDIQAQVAVLQRRISAILDKRFQTWKPVTPADCEKVYPGQSKADAMKQLRRIPAPTKTELEGDAMFLQAVGSLNFGRKEA